MDVMESLSNTKIKVVVQKQGESVASLIRLGDIFSINETDLSDEFARQAALYAYFSTQMAYTENAHAKAVMSREESYAGADEYYRGELTIEFKESGRKLTEAVVKASIVQDELYQTALIVERSAKLDYRLLRAICQALEMRGTMLQSLGAHLRHELDMTGMTTKERQYRSQVGDAKDVIAKARRRQV